MILQSHITLQAQIRLRCIYTAPLAAPPFQLLSSDGKQMLHHHSLSAEWALGLTAAPLLNTSPAEHVSTTRRRWSLHKFQAKRTLPRHTGNKWQERLVLQSTLIFFLDNGFRNDRLNGRGRFRTSGVLVVGGGKGGFEMVVGLNEEL